MAIGTTVFRAIQNDYIVQQNNGAVTIGAHTGDPGADGTANEVTGGSYARGAAPTWALDADTSLRRVELGANVDVAGMPAVGAPGVSWLSIWVGANFYTAIPASAAQVVQVGNTLRILAGTAITNVA